MDFTPYLKLQKPPFDDIPWDEAVNTNMDKIDAFAAQFLGIPNYVGAWQNATAYVSGQNVSDVTTAAVYQTHVTHTSSALPTTFAQERVNHPTYWELVSTSAPPSTLSGNTGRNLIHNPMLNIAQRGAGPWTTNGAYTADRWQLGLATDTASVSIIQPGLPSTLGDEACKYALRNIFTGNSAANAYNQITQRIENVLRLSGKTVTVSFYAVASAGLKLGCNIYQSWGTGGSPSTGGYIQPTGAQFTLGTTWRRYSTTFTIPSASGKVLGTVGDDFTQLVFAYSSGATNNAILGNIGVQSGTVYIWGVQLEVGSVATPLEKPDPRYDLSNCQRFYCRDIAANMAFTSAANGNLLAISVPFPVTMRATPLLTTLADIVAPVGTASITADSANTWGFRVLVVSNAAVNVSVERTYTASADL